MTTQFTLCNTLSVYEIKTIQKFIKTSAQISSELKGAILAFHSSTLSMRKIVDQLLVMGETNY
jgi:hypothetical protein